MKINDLFWTHQEDAVARQTTALKSVDTGESGKSQSEADYLKRKPLLDPQTGRNTSLVILTHRWRLSVN